MKKTISYDPRRVGSGIAAIVLTGLCIFLYNPIIQTLQELVGPINERAHDDLGVSTNHDLGLAIIVSGFTYLLIATIATALVSAAKKDPLKKFNENGLIRGFAATLISVSIIGLVVATLVAKSIWLSIIWILFSLIFGLIMGLILGLIGEFGKERLKKHEP